MVATKIVVVDFVVVVAVVVELLLLPPLLLLLLLLLILLLLLLQLLYETPRRESARRTPLPAAGERRAAFQPPSCNARTPPGKPPEKRCRTLEAHLRQRRCCRGASGAPPTLQKLHTLLLRLLLCRCASACRRGRAPAARCPPRQLRCCSCCGGCCRYMPRNRGGAARALTTVVMKMPFQPAALLQLL